jgi:Ca2+-transporting ATPase
VRKNPALLGAVALTVLLQLAVTYLPFLQQLFETQPLSLSELLLCIALGFIMLLGVELEKLLFRHSEERTQLQPAIANRSSLTSGEHKSQSETR